MTEELFDYVQNHTSPEPLPLSRLTRETHLTQVYPQMLSGHIQGTLLRMICQMIKPDRVLEIGTFTGYSAIAMGLGMNSQESTSPPAPGSESTSPPAPGSENTSPPAPGSESTSPPAPLLEERGEGAHIIDCQNNGGVLHTIEVNPEFEDGIRRHIREAGLEDRIVLHIGEAMTVIPTLGEVWDLVFIDADKPNYLNYYNLILPQVRCGGFIIADNVLWDGKVVGDPATMDKDTRGIVAFNEFVHQDNRVENLLLPVRDGLMIMRKNGDTKQY
jgi:predicted O-methyltransferase YrrM